MLDFKIIILILMKNLRIAKKNPSKILKIIDMQPATYRYMSQNDQAALTLRTNPIQMTSYSKEHKNIETQKNSSLRHSPSRSQRIIQIKPSSKNKKFRNRSLGSSQEAIINPDESSSLLKFRNSHQYKIQHVQSPYLRKPKFRQSEKLLNFHSVSLNEKARKQERRSKQKQIFKNSTKTKNSQMEVEHIEGIDSRNKALNESLDNARRLLGQGEYRKSLLLVKNILQNNPSHLESLYLSAVNWYHLEDRVKSLLFLQQIFMINASYSPECFKMAAVCYSKSFEYSKSLACLANCHKHFPKESQSYEIQGRILGKVNKWDQALKAYQCGYELSKNSSFLVNRSACHQKLNQFHLALQCLQKTLESGAFSFSVGVKKMQIHCKLNQFQQIIEIYEMFSSFKMTSQKEKQIADFLYLAAYSYYKIKKYSLSLVVIEEGMNLCINHTRFNKLLLMVRIHQRDIYEAFHLVTRIKDDPQLKVIMKFIEGAIQLMRRNYQDGISKLLSIQRDIGFMSQFSQEQNITKSEKGSDVADEFQNQIRKIYLMFLSYGYYNLSEFRICRKLFNLQSLIGVPQYFNTGFQYNFEMCKGILLNCDKQFQKAQIHFLKAAEVFVNKLEPPFCIALNCLQMMVNSKIPEDKKKIAEHACQYFEICQKIVGKAASNTAAGVYYFSSLLHGYMQNWKRALDCIDESIERSEDHYWRYFYIRGLILACIHSFHEAVNDLSLAVALSGITRPECYLLRSKCLQIEGQGNEAFKDLQQYISLKPDDPEVHKYAGQLLFENGAFQDSLVAFSHQPIAPLLENYDIFLTQGKSYFLLGRFKEALDAIKQAQQLKHTEEVQYDLIIIEHLDSLSNKLKPIASIEQGLDIAFSQHPKFGKIFKKSDYHILKAACHTYEKAFEGAATQFLLAIQQKTHQLGSTEQEDESGIIENKRDLMTFINHMRYNIVLCKLAKGERQDAINIYKQITIDLDQPYYRDFVNFKKFLTREIELYKKDEVFPSRNKLSNFLSKIEVAIQSRNKQENINLFLKLCIPFPKVQPPEIFPTFDSTLLERLSVLNVQRKPEAPWVLRQNNSIKFTDKIQIYSHFQLEDSEMESSSTYQMISIDQSHLDPSQRSRRLKTSEVKHIEEGGRLSRMDH